MPKKIVTRGYGITARKEVQVTGAEDIKTGILEWAESFGSLYEEGGPFWASVAGWREWADGLLPDDKYDTSFEEQSIEWYAQQILLLINRIRKQIDGDKASNAASDAFDLGVLCAEVRIKFLWEGHALRGEKTKKSASDGGLARAHSMRHRSLEIIEEINRIIRENPQLSQIRASQIAYDRGFGSSANANRRLFYRHKKGKIEVKKLGQ